MFHKLIAPIFIFLFSISTQAQITTHSTVYAGYQYQNQSFGELGARFIFLKNDDFLYRLGGGVLLGSVNSQFAVIPKIQGEILVNTEKNVDIHHSYYFLTGAEISTKHISPKIGASLLGIIDLTAGYAFPLDKNGINGKKLQGLNFNFTLNIPLAVFSK